MRRLNMPMFFLALMIALAVKFAVYEPELLSERVIEAQVTYKPPSDDVISYNRIDKVKVGLRGRSSEIAQLSLFNVEVLVDVPEGRRGPTEINLAPANVRTQGGSFDVISIEPNRFTIQVEPRLEAEIPITAELVGEPAAGARQGEPVVQPPRAKVTGPESLVRGVNMLTASVRLDGHARTFTDTVLVTSPDPLVQVIEPAFVEVLVPMQEPELSISFDELAEEGSKT